MIYIDRMGVLVQEADIQNAPLLSCCELGGGGGWQPKIRFRIGCRNPMDRLVHATQLMAIPRHWKRLGLAPVAAHPLVRWLSVASPSVKRRADAFKPTTHIKHLTYPSYRRGGREGAGERQKGRVCTYKKKNGYKFFSLVGLENHGCRT